MEKYSRLLNPVFLVTSWITVILLTVMVVFYSFEITMRTFTDFTPAWAKEVVLLSMVWMGCLGSAVLHRERGHITLEFLVDRFLPRARGYVLIMVDVLILVFSGFLLYGGIVVVIELMGQARPGTNLPVGVSYLPLAVTGLLLILAAFEHLMEDVTARIQKGEEADAS
ncbi:MAG: TRAP transporter small permease [bacterium]